MVTLKELAKMCDVSPSTVSNVLNGKNSMSNQVRERVLEAVKSTGYQPNIYARNMRVNKTETIGIIVEDLCQFSSPYIVEMILDNLEKKNYWPVLVNLRMYHKLDDNIEDEDGLCRILEPIIQNMKSIKVDGIIYVAAHCRTLKKVPKFFDVPTVFTYAYAGSGEKKSVIIDDENSALEMMEYIISKGHTDIGIIAGSEENYHTIARLKGCQQAFFNAGLLYDPDKVGYGSWNRESGRRQAEVILKKGVTALWCMNDRMAAGAYEAAREMGLTVGKDISIAGFDNIELAENLYPSLTTCKLPLYEIGTKAADLLIDMLENKNDSTEEKSPVKILGEMFVRDSVVDIK